MNLENKKAVKMYPQLRFQEFEGEWSEKQFGRIAKFFSGGTPSSTDKKYYTGSIPFIKSGEISAHITEQFISEAGLKNSSAKLVRDGDLLYALYGATAGEVSISKINGAINQAILCIRSNENNQFIYNLFLKRKERLLATYLQGGQGNLSAQIIKNLNISLPQLPEQQKIASFLSAVDKKIQQLTQKKELLEKYKKGMMQKIFSQEIRFRDENGEDYPKWEERKFNEILFEHGSKSTGNEDVFSVSVHKGVVNQIEHLGRSFAASSTDHYNQVKPHDIVYTKSPTGDFPYGIIKQARIHENVIVSPLYGVFTAETKWLGYMLNVYFESVSNTHNYLHSIIQKGAKNTINITNKTFLSKKLKLPISHDEQKQIGMFLKNIDGKISFIKSQITETQQFKKGLLQQMFV